MCIVEELRSSIDGPRNINVAPTSAQSIIATEEIIAKDKGDSIVLDQNTATCRLFDLESTDATLKRERGCVNIQRFNIVKGAPRACTSMEPPPLETESIFVGAMLLDIILFSIVNIVALKLLFVR